MLTSEKCAYYPLSWCVHLELWDFEEVAYFHCMLFCSVSRSQWSIICCYCALHKQIPSGLHQL